MQQAYVGKTKLHLIVRQYKHLGKSISTEKLLKYSDNDVTAIRKHCHSLIIWLVLITFPY